MATAWTIGCRAFWVAMTALKRMVWGRGDVGFTTVASPEKGKKRFQDSRIQGLKGVESDFIEVVSMIVLILSLDSLNPRPLGSFLGNPSGFSQ
jgi:hypothetical protein